MEEPLDERYFKWLYRQVAPVSLKNPARTYWSLFRQLFAKEFIWLVPNDDNRVEDGRDLRYEFLKEKDIPLDKDWVGIGCSMFEMLLGLSRRLSFESEGRSRGWFWQLLKNLDLEHYTDAYFEEQTPVLAETVDEILDDVIWRTYYPNGEGGLFPLERPKEDQRDVELWYQLSSYLLERE